ncbi:MAG: Cell wall assembly regulator [Chrysothrix sp. TS-e1954]|nr:MAG: Cell wall assembly regulator [Chrysothrix sp. TS-e1954]
MSFSFGSAWRTFWHTMTSNDRHASHNSPYRTGQHVPLPQSRHDPLTSVATNATDSRSDVNAPFSPNATDSANPYSTKGPVPATPGSPYTPGMRSAMQRTQSDDFAPSRKGPTTEIQMQAFSDGLPPAPPVGHSWKRIDRWTEDNYEELWDNVSPGCTQNDINELEHELDCTLPMEVRESLQVHDGQERGGRPTGIIFGCMLLDCEEIVQEWRNWRTVTESFLADQVTTPSPQVPSKAFDGASSSSNPLPQNSMSNSSHWRDDLLARQDSQPPNAIQKAYSHSAWIPLARDWGGNNLAVDLVPGPAGKWGQVILMGRDYDCKYVVARSWAALLATVADDLGTSKVFVHEETGELKLREFKQQSVEPAYLDILRWRADQKYGRRGPRRKAGANGDLRLNSNVLSSAGRSSPYGSPTAADSDRGRSPQRFPTRGINSGSPQAVSSPLARVAEEAPGSKRDFVNSPTKMSQTESALIDMQTPQSTSMPDPFADHAQRTQHDSATPDGKENKKGGTRTGLGVQDIDVEATKSGSDEMKTVEI